MNTRVKNRFFKTPADLKAAVATLTEWASTNGHEYTEEECNGFPKCWNDFVAYRVTIKGSTCTMICNFELPVCYWKNPNRK